VRELRERVAYAPMNGRVKVYIVDEVHMLTKEANNALLKTLEEPPPHVKFFFATTEPQKLLDTVRSRCQIVQLALIREEEIARHLTRILELEGVSAEAGVVEELARAARGSMRDALSLTDQLLALVGTAPRLEDVRRIAGAGGAEAVDALLDALEAGARADVLARLAPSQGNELELVDALLEHVRGALVAELCPREAALFESEPAERERRAARAARLGVERLQVWLEELLIARERMGQLESHARIVLEVTLLDLCRRETALPLEELAARLLALESRLGAVSASGAVLRPAPRASAPPAAAPSAVPAPTAARAPERAAARPAPAAAPAPAPARQVPPSARSAPGAAASERPRPEPPAAADDFTHSVADLFTGQIEEP
jgi:DNA polymerase-3 subunit gamma/tau